jgi:hypothetical protein
MSGKAILFYKFYVIISPYSQQNILFKKLKYLPLQIHNWMTEWLTLSHKSSTHILQDLPWMDATYSVTEEHLFY